MEAGPCSNASRGTNRAAAAKLLRRQQDVDETAHTAGTLAAALRGMPGLMASFESSEAPIYSIVAEPSSWEHLVVLGSCAITETATTT